MAQITIYSTATCGFCKMLKQYLKDKDVTYNEKKADEDPKLAQELFEKSGQLGVPFSIIKTKDGKEISVLGFDRPQIDHALKLM